MKYVELNAFLKKVGLADSGGHAKSIIRERHVLLNGTIETQNKKKLRKGDLVSVQGKTFEVKEEYLLKDDGR